MLNPVLVFSGINNPSSYNYAYIPDFRRYYYVTEWEANRNLWIVSLSVDVLASFKTEIGDSTCYIGRSESSYDGNIVDSLYPTVGAYTMRTTFFDSIWTEANTHSGEFVIGVANSVPTGTGACYYVTNYAGFDAIRSILYGDDFFELVQNSFWTPGDFILSCKWFPTAFPKNAGPNSGRLTAIELGSRSYNVPDNVNIYYLSSALSASNATSVEVPVHPQSESRGKYLKLSPYTKHSLFFPPFGLIDIDPGISYDLNTMFFEVIVDPLSGIGTLSVGGGFGIHTIAQTNIGVDIPMSSRDVNIGGMVSNGVAAGAAIGGVAKAAANIASAGTGVGTLLTATGIATAAIGNAAASAIPTSQNVTTSSGSISQYGIQPRVISSFINIANENADTGRPLLQDKKINTLSGFVQIIDPHFEIAMTDSEMNELMRTAGSGFFYE